MSRSNKSERRYTSAKERADKQGTGFSAAYLRLPDKVQLFKPKPGVMLLDILPFEAGEGNPWASKGALHWERTVWVHKGVGANNDAYVCPRLNSKSRCPICEHRAKLMKAADSDPETEQLVKDLAPKQRQLFNVINLKDPDKGVQLWDVSYHLFGKVLDARLRNSDEEDEFDSFFFMEGGKTLKVGFVEKSFGGATFSEAETIDFRSRKEDYEEDILEKTHCLDDLLIEADYDDIKTAFLQTDEDAAPKPAKGKGKPADEEEEEDDEPDDEDAPAGKPSKSRKPADEEEDEEEEEEEEAPAKKSKKPAPKDEEDWDDFDEDDKPAKGKGKPADEEEEEEEEEPSPKKRKPAVEEDEEEEEEEEKPAPKRKSRAAKPAAEDEEEEDDEPHVRTHSEAEVDESRKSRKPAPKADEDDWDEEEEEDEKPAPKKRK